MIASAVRSQKEEALKALYSKYGGRVEVAVVDDLAGGDLTDALRGVSALIHVASPRPGHNETRALIDVSTLSSCPLTHEETHLNTLIGCRQWNVIRQAADAGIEHISFTGSIGAFGNLAEPVVEAPFTEKYWNSYTEEQAFTSQHPMLPYLVSKKLAEQTLWKLADKYPKLNLTTGKPPVSSCVDPLKGFSPPFQSAQLLSSVHSLKTSSSPQVMSRGSAHLSWPIILSTDQRPC